MEGIRSCSISMDSPGARTVKESGLFLAMTVAGTYLALMPVNAGEAPAESDIVNVFSGRVDSGVRGSLRSFKASSPVLTKVATTFRSATVSTAVGPVLCANQGGLIRWHKEAYTDQKLSRRDQVQLKPQWRRETA